MRAMRAMVTLLMLASCKLAIADQLYMQNGSVLVGTLVRAVDDAVIFNTPFSGEIKVTEANIKRVITDETVVIMMDDGTIYRDRRIDATEGKLVAKAGGEAPVTFVSTDINMINPEPWRLGEGYKWTGNLKVAAEYERGNSDTDEWDASAKTEWRSLKDRYTLDGEFERDRNDGRKTGDNWTMTGKYDRFSKRDSRNYWGGNLRLEYDRFADLDLRTTIGPHIGRQFLETGLIDVWAELGPVWVDEDFDEAEDNDFPGALWGLAATSDIIGFGTMLYVNHDGIFNYDDPNDLILNTTVGLKMPLIFGFETGVEAKWEYDGGAVEDVDDLDETYNFFVGYAW